MGSIFTLPPRKAFGSVGVGVGGTGVGVAVSSGATVGSTVGVGSGLAVGVGGGSSLLLSGFLLKKNRLSATIWGWNDIPSDRKR